MPPSIRDAIIQPIPKGSKDPSVAANYRGIALASSLSKVLEWSVLINWSCYLTTSELQFGFKPGYSTTLCSGVLKAIVSKYLNKGSRVYTCLTDASKAFDTVDHNVLFNKLLDRDVPKPLVHLLLQWYTMLTGSVISEIPGHQRCASRWCSQSNLVSQLF